MLLFLFGKENKKADIKPVSFWEDLFLKDWDKDSGIAKQQSLSNDSWKYYFLAYSIDANTTMFQATGNKKYLDRALEYIENMISSAQRSRTLQNSQYKDDYLGWSNHSHPELGNDGKEYPLYESFCWRYVTTLLRILHQSPSILSIPKYNVSYQRIFDFTEKNIYNKWVNRGLPNLYRINAHMMSHWVRISADMYIITGQNKYKKIVDDFITMFKRQEEIKLDKYHKKSLQWKAEWDRSKPNYQDVSHGNAVVGTIILLYENKLGFSYNDIEMLIETFDKLIWTGKDVYANEFDGSGEGNGWFSDGLIQLGRYDTNLQKRIEEHPVTFGQGTQLYGNGALNAVILLNKKSVYPKR